VQKLTTDEFVAAWQQAACSPIRVSELTGLSLRNVYDRRRRLEKQGIILPTIETTGRESPYAPPAHFERRRLFDVPNGTVVVFSDPHFYPDHSGAAVDALCTVIERVKPELVICGGDVLDGTQLGRFPPVRGHHQPPGVREQLECCVRFMGQIQRAAGKARMAWTLGNHDVRLSRHIAVHAPELLDLPFTRLEDWLPAWWLSWTVEINTGTTGMLVVRHRNQPGMTHLQSAKAGTHYAHGHRHQLNVHVAPTFNGYRYSTDVGSLADADSDAFDYAEGDKPHVQGFAVFTFSEQTLMMPELCYRQGDAFVFRGEAV
jgi:hypothetical protein